MAVHKSLLDYIEQGIKSGFSVEQIVTALRQAGWQEQDISAGMATVQGLQGSIEPQIPSAVAQPVAVTYMTVGRKKLIYISVAVVLIIVVGLGIFFSRSLIKKQVINVVDTSDTKVTVFSPLDGVVANYDESRYDYIEVVNNDKGCFATVLRHKNPAPVPEGMEWPEQRLKDIAFNDVLIKDVYPGERLSEALYFSEDCRTLVFGSYDRVSGNYYIYKNNERMETDISISDFRFEPKTQKLYYYGSAKDPNGHQAWYAYADGRKFGPFTDNPKGYFNDREIDFVRFSPNGQHYAFFAHEMIQSAPTANGTIFGSGQDHLISNGQASENFDAIFDYAIDDNGNLSYLAFRNKEGEYFYRNGKLEMIKTTPGEESDTEGAVLSPDGSQYIITKYVAEDRYKLIINGRETEQYIAHPYLSLQPTLQPIFSPDGRHYAYQATSDGMNFFTVLDGKRSDNFPTLTNDSSKSAMSTFLKFTPDNILYFDITTGFTASNGMSENYSTCLYRNNVKSVCSAGIQADYVFQSGSYAFIYRKKLSEDTAHHSVVFNAKEYTGVDYNKGGVNPPVISPDGTKVAYISAEGVYANETQLHNYANLSQPFVEKPLITKDNRVIYVLSRFTPRDGSPLDLMLKKGATMEEIYEKLDYAGMDDGVNELEVYSDSTAVATIKANDNEEIISDFFLSSDGKSLRYVVKDLTQKKLLLKSVALIKE